MEKEKIEFITKIYVQQKSKRPVIRAMAKIIFIIYILLFLFIIAMEGFSFDIIKSNFIPLILLIYIANSTKPVDGYKNIVVNVEVKDDQIEITYDGLDRDDKMGPRVEKTVISYYNITKLEYSNPLACLNIQGYPIESVKYLKQNSNKEFITNFVKKKKEKRTLLYVSKNEKEKIINAIEQGTNLKVIELN